jgi:hypothetical protein
MTKPHHQLPNGDATASKESSTPAKLLVASVASFVLAVVALVILGSPVFAMLLAVAVVLLIFALISGAREGKRRPPTVAAPMAFTHSGEPIYPVVGYTSGGQPVTADQVAGPIPAASNPRTNSYAVVALVLGLILGPLAIPFGHIARTQIRRTGEQGAGMALAGLILGYFSLCAVAFVVLRFSSIS